MNLIKRIKLWWLSKVLQFWSQQAEERMEATIQYQNRVLELERRIAELGGVR